MFNRRKFLKLGVAAGASLLLAKQAQAQTTMPEGGPNGPDRPTPMKKITIKDRKAAAARMRKKGFQLGIPAVNIPAVSQGGKPDYFGSPNWAISPLPHGPVDPATVVIEEPGEGYTAATIATVDDAVGPGSGATATVTVTNGQITAVTIGAVGSGYRAPVINFHDDPVAGGSGAVVSVKLDLTQLSGGMRKFIDTLPGLTPAGANSYDNYIPVAVPDTITYKDADYYEISVEEYDHQFHSELGVTTHLRGYRQTNQGTDPDTNLNTVNPDAQVHYLGPVIVARKNRPVRIKFTNNLPTGAGGDLYIPVDTSIMGAGLGPTAEDGQRHMYTQNRISVHNHGARTPWISDGTAHQWIVPAGENTYYKKGQSVYGVADMDQAEEGSMTVFYTNQQSARLLFYHDHAWGITRLNVYTGLAAGYLITDDVENDLITGKNVTGVNPNLLKVIPDDKATLPLIFQDKGFVDADTVLKGDPTWMWGTGQKHDIIDSITGETRTVRYPVHGDLWYPHVYVPAQNPGDLSGVNTFGRWHYGPWFWPPTTGIEFLPVPNDAQPDAHNPYWGPDAPWEPYEYPGLPDMSIIGESFMDTALVNGVAYPTITLEPKAYRFRMLNGSNDRFVNLQLYVADPDVVTPDGRSNTEVRMVEARAQAGFPADWPVDGREGGVPDWTLRGPDWIVIGNEAGFLPWPVVVPPQPITWNMNPTTFNFGNVDKHSLLLAPAERADVIVDFSGYENQTLIVYNDAPTAFPALDPRYDYYTGSPDLSAEGGAPSIIAGYGPNTRTFMQIKIEGQVAEAYDLTALQSVWRCIPNPDPALPPLKPSVFQAGQDDIIAPFNAYNLAYGKSFPSDAFARIFSTKMHFMTVKGNYVDKNLEPKSIQDEMGEAFDKEYGRMQSKLGVEMPNTNAGNMNFVLYEFIDPVTESFQATLPGTPLSNFNTNPNDGTQFWKITHNGVDTHPIHFHLFDVQVINRVGWDGAIRLPHPTEYGWKETVRISPLEDTIVAFRPILPKIPFGVPNSERYLDPSRDPGTTGQFTSLDPLTGEALPVPTSNIKANFGWEYTWHCHILSHEEMDMMRATVMNVTTQLPTAPVLTYVRNASELTFSWTDATPWIDGTTLAEQNTPGNPANEIGFKLQRAKYAGVPVTNADYVDVSLIPANRTAATTILPDTTNTYFYRVVAWNNSGESPSNTVVFGSGASIAAPSMVQLTASLTTTALTMRVSWRDNSTNETKFVVERSVNDGAFQVIGEVVSTTQAGTGTRPLYNDLPGWLPGASLRYRVKAVNDLGESAYSYSVAYAVRPKPAAPTNLAYTWVQTSGLYYTATLTWTDNATNESIQALQRASNSTFTTGLQTSTLSANLTSAVRSSLRFGIRYYFRVAAVNQGGYSDWSNVLTVYVPTAPVP